MKPTAEAAVAARPLDPTGRDGAIDFVAHDVAAHGADGHVFGQTEQFTQLMGMAIIDIWGEMPRGIQELLFDHAITLGKRAGYDDTLREQLAKFLHDHHPRTAR